MADSQATDPAPTDPIVETDQGDGAQPPSMLHEPEYDVQVELSDLQKDTENPLGSAVTFDQLGLYVCHHSAPTTPLTYLSFFL